MVKFTGELKVLINRRSNNLVLMTNRKPTSETPMKRKLDAISTSFSRWRTQKFNLMDKNPNPSHSLNNIDNTDLKMEKKLINDYLHSGANRKIMDNMNKRDKSPELLRLVEIRPEITKPRDLQFKVDKN